MAGIGSIRMQGGIGNRSIPGVGRRSTTGGGMRIRVVAGSGRQTRFGRQHGSLGEAPVITADGRHCRHTRCSMSEWAGASMVSA